MTIIINSLGDAHTCTHIHTDFLDKSNFKKLGLCQSTCTWFKKHCMARPGSCVAHDVSESFTGNVTKHLFHALLCDSTALLMCYHNTKLH